MEEIKNRETVDTKKEKLTYEELERVAHQLSEQSKQLYMKLQTSNMDNLFKRLDYLFKVVENADHFKTEFVTICVDEIERMITVSEEEGEKAE